MTRHFPLGVGAIILAFVCCWTALGQEAGDEPTKQPELTPEQKAKLEERDRCSKRMQELQKEGKLKEAIEAAEKVLAIEREVYGDVHEDVAGSLETLADIHEELAAWGAARKAREEVVAITTTLLGAEHHKVTDARLSLTNVETLAQLTAEQRQRLANAAKLNLQVVGLYGQGKPQEAISLAQQVCTTQKEVLGEEHPDYATTLNNLAALYRSMGDYAKAEPLYVQARDVFSRVLGEEHPSYATSLNNLAGFYYSMSDYAKAEPLYVEASDIRKRVLGEEHPDYAVSLNNLALLYASMSDYTKAEPLYVQARDITKRALGDEHPLYALSLNNLAQLYESMGDYAKAEPLLVQARDIRKRVLGEEHPDYADEPEQPGRLV